MNLSEFVNYYLKSLIDKEDSLESILVNPESVVEKPTNYIINLCKALPNCDVVGQETSRPSLAEIVDLKSPNKSIEATSSTSTLGGQQNKGNSAGCAATGLTGAWIGLTSAQTDLTGGQPCLTASSRVLQNKSKPKMIKPKNPRLVFGKQLNPKAVISINEKS
jgi:hypothetical protein